MKEIQVLTPMHRGITGASQLNRNLQEKINPDAKGIEHREQWFRVGDKIMQQQNHYEKQIFNAIKSKVAEIGAGNIDITSSKKENPLISIPYNYIYIILYYTSSLISIFCILIYISKYYYNRRKKI